MKKKWKIIGAAIGVVLAIPLILVAVYIIGSMPGDTSKLEAVGNQFKPDPSWKLISKNVYPPRAICIDGPCGAVYYTWSTKRRVSKEDFNSALKHSNFFFNVEGECNPTNAPSGSGASICEANGTISNAHTRVYVTSSSDNPDNQTISLEILNK